MADETWRLQKTPAFYGDLIWRDDHDDHQTLIAEVHWPGAAERIVAAVNQAADLTRQLAEERAARLALEDAVKPVMAYLTASVESANNQGNLKNSAPADRLAGVNDVWLRRSDIEGVAAALRGAAVRDGGE